MDGRYLGGKLFRPSSDWTRDGPSSICHGSSHGLCASDFLTRLPRKFNIPTTYPGKGLRRTSDSSHDYLNDHSVDLNSPHDLQQRSSTKVRASLPSFCCLHSGLRRIRFFYRPQKDTPRARCRAPSVKVPLRW